MDHSLLEAIGHNLTAPMPLFFVLGILATLIRSDLKVPEALYIGLTLYLLAAIGLHGGAEIREVGLTAIWIPLMGTMFLGILIPIVGTSSFARSESFPFTMPLRSLDTMGRSAP